jgi:polyisoprenyl-teichoic acid--peptidoglycan teichoic acid transferase
MTKKHNNSIDGFVPRRTANQQLGSLHKDHGQDIGPTPPTLRELHVASDPRPERTASISRSEIDESLKGIDTPVEEKRGRKRRTPEQKARRRKMVGRVFACLVVIIVALGGYVGVKALLASGNVFKGNIFDIVQHAPLKMDANGRSNIIVVGTSEDDPGHQGATLTDSMMIVSIDQNAKNAYMISIPRDMQVKYGQACNSGYAGKINEYYGCVHEGQGVDADRAALAKEAEFVGNIFDLDIQYGVNVNYTVMRDLVNAVGGNITVNIESRNPNGQMDSNFDWKCGVGDRKVTRAEVLRRCPPHGHFIDYPNGPAVLDAEHALYLAQARGDAVPTYGFEQSNFDREKNQQKIIKALREKAVSAGVLADFNKVAGLIDALGNNLRTTFETKEFRTLVDLAKDIKSDDIKSISLIDGDVPVMDGNGNPRAGIYQYDAIRTLVKKSLSSDPVVSEEAEVQVMNGSGVSGVAQTEANKLEDQGFTIGTIATAPAGEYGKYTIYQIGDGNSGTAAKLKKLYGVDILKTPPPFTPTVSAKFVLIIGKASTTTDTSN